MGSKGIFKKIREFLKILTEEHNFVNLFWFNFHKVDEGVYRSAQLTPWRLRKVIKKYRIKTIINLRATDNYLYKREEEICREMGVEYRVISIASRTLPKYDEVEQLSFLLSTLPRPILIHCKAGADRTGFVAALWHVLNGRSGKEAVRRELRLRYGYIPLGRVGKIKELFLSFPGGDFLKWYRRFRDPIEEGFQPKRVGEFIYEYILGREG
jgi:protein tyrosine/serine phosphatase